MASLCFNYIILILIFLDEYSSFNVIIIMVVSMDVTENTIEGGVEPTLDDNDTHIENNDENNEGFTSIASASTEPINTNNSIHSNSIDANEADTTYENYYKSKSIVPDEKPKTELTCELHNGGDLFSNGLKDLINLQLDLIEYQQAKITNKDKQIMVLKNEKEQVLGCFVCYFIFYFFFIKTSQNTMECLH